jgi:hypothetical protein
MQTYEITITGKTPLLMHHDNIEWADYMAEWHSNPENKKMTKAGEDRTPPWQWIGHCYNDGKTLVIPAGNIMRSIMDGGAMVPTGSRGKTFKSQTQSGMMSRDPFWPVLCNGKTIPWKEIEAMRSLPDFAANKKKANDLGFDLFVKRARVTTQKHVRVRPMFAAGWQLHGALVVWDEQITRNILLQILNFSGQYKGLGDWRPGARTPGPYGMFEAKIL